MGPYNRSRKESQFVTSDFAFEAGAVGSSRGSPVSQAWDRSNRQSCGVGGVEMQPWAMGQNHHNMLALHEKHVDTTWWDAESNEPTVAEEVVNGDIAKIYANALRAKANTSSSCITRYPAPELDRFLQNYTYIFLSMILSPIQFYLLRYPINSCLRWRVPRSQWTGSNLLFVFTCVCQHDGVVAYH